MKKLVLLVVGLAICLTPVATMAQGVSGTPHDFSSGSETGIKNEMCQSCHLAHQAQSTVGGVLWAQSTTVGEGLGYTGTKALCYTCHDGSISTALGGVYDAAYSSHKMENIAECSADNSTIASCHDVHDNTKGSFLVSDSTAAGSYCEGCHDADGPPGALSWTGSDHTGAANHTYATLACQDCHAVHTAASTQTTVADSVVILIQDNSWSDGVKGAFCESCHNGTYGGSTVADQHSYDDVAAAADAYDLNHPTRGGDDAMTGCLQCHTVHGSSEAYILKDDNESSAYCTNTCHLASGGTIGPDIGGTHPVTAAATLTGIPVSDTLPFNDAMDDDGTVGADWSPATTYMICETCHSTHGRTYTSASYRANQAVPLLRVANGANNEMCVSCHTAN